MARTLTGGRTVAASSVGPLGDGAGIGGWMPPVAATCPVSDSPSADHRSPLSDVAVPATVGSRARYSAVAEDGRMCADASTG